MIATSITSRPSIWLVAALAVWFLGCTTSAVGNRTSSADAAEASQVCAFSIAGSTVDKVKSDGHNAILRGSTLDIGCFIHPSPSSISTVFTASIKAFDGVGQYRLDATDATGTVTYYGNDGAAYHLSDYVAGTQPVCVFDFVEGPAEPKAGDVLAANFSCEGLQSYASGAARHVDLSEGSLRVVVAAQ